MPTLQETAYPRLKSSVSARDLASLYTPTPAELALARQAIRGAAALLGFLVLLKTFQRLGCFVPVSQVPGVIVEHPAKETQTEAALLDLPGYDLAGTRFRHLTVIRDVINAYQRFTLPKRWGSGKHASADGTKWDLYEQNLLAEYPIRYGGYGGIGYYHVSDTYIALFSHFIPCGVWEAVYILDGLLKNETDLQPDTLHADTQGQSAPVFGLALLLGISLMPRIRNWKDLTLLRPEAETSFEHLEPLFSGAVDWPLIQTHLPDLLRVVLSIKAGRITASTLL